MSTPIDDPLHEAVSLVEGATTAGLQLRLLVSDGLTTTQLDAKPLTVTTR